MDCCSHTRKTMPFQVESDNRSGFISFLEGMINYAFGLLSIFPKK